MPELEWEELDSGFKRTVILRSPVPGGWLVYASDGSFSDCPASLAMTFVPDSDHSWDGGSVTTEQEY